MVQWDFEVYVRQGTLKGTIPCGGIAQAFVFLETFSIQVNNLRWKRESRKTLVQFGQLLDFRTVSSRLPRLLESHDLCIGLRTAVEETTGGHSMHAHRFRRTFERISDLKPRSGAYRYTLGALFRINHLTPCERGEVLGQSVLSLRRSNDQQPISGSQLQIPVGQVCVSITEYRYDLNIILTV